MSHPSISSIQSALKNVKYPGFTRDIISFGLVKNIEIKASAAHISLTLTTQDPTITQKLTQDIQATLNIIPGINQTHVHTTTLAPKGTTNSSAKHTNLQKIRYIIAVASGKGGVGKSTFSVNLACALAHILKKETKNVGILDCDIYGPSIPLMIGIHDQPHIEEDLIQPLYNFGVKVMSMGLLIDENTPVVWRGPMIMKTIQQFVTNVNWGELEILVVDLPPGTGDAQLSLVQTIPLDGVVIVTTPQLAAVSVARRGALMFPKVNVPFLGVVENMSGNGGSTQTPSIFGQGGGAQTAQDLQTTLLGSIPLDICIREGADRGIPIVLSHPESYSSTVIFEIANSILEKLTCAPKEIFT